jgi:hypothetical protein
MEEVYKREGCEAEISGGLVVRYLDEERVCGDLR